MKNKNKRLLTALLLIGLGGLTSLQAQEAITTAGGEAGSASGTVSYTVGQTVYTTETGTNGNSIAQGVQQPFEISVVGIAEAQGISLSVSAYPNPTSDYLTVKVDASTSLNIQSLSYQLFDISGKLIESKKLTGNETQIKMDMLVPANYFLKVYAVGKNDRTGILDNNKELKTFKIIKN